MLAWVCRIRPGPAGTELRRRATSAQPASRSPDRQFIRHMQLRARHRRLSRRRGKAKALVAVGNTQLKVYHKLLSTPRHAVCRPRADYYERQRDTRRQIAHHVGKLGALGFEVTLCRLPNQTPTPARPPAPRPPDPASPASQRAGSAGLPRARLRSYFRVRDQGHPKDVRQCLGQHHRSSTRAAEVSLVITDDIDGSPGAETVSFGPEGVRYEIDIATPNRVRLADAAAPYLATGRTISRNRPHDQPRPAARRPASRCVGRPCARGRGTRAWRSPTRGRISAEVMRQYQATR